MDLFMAQLYLLPQHRCLSPPHAWKLHTPADNGTAQLPPHPRPVATLLAAETDLWTLTGDLLLNTWNWKGWGEDAGQR